MKHSTPVFLALFPTLLGSASVAFAQDPATEPSDDTELVEDADAIPPPPDDGAPLTVVVAPPTPMAAPPAEAVAAPESEPRRARHLIFGEVLGAGLFYSVNYERLVHEDLGLRLGFGSVPLSGTTSAGERVDANFLTIPITLSYLGIGSTRHIFEVGGGVTLGFVTAAVDDGLVTRRSAGAGAIGTAFAGYRYHPRDPGGFHFRGGVMALMARGVGPDGDPDGFGALPWPYLGFGGGF